MLINLISRLPFWLLYRVADIMYLVLYYGRVYRRDIVFANLRKAFPEMPEAQIKRYAKECFQHLADLAIEIIKARTMSAAEIIRRNKILNPEIIDKYCGNQQSLLLLTIHQGNWEWLLLATCLQLPFPIDAIYKPQHHLVDGFLNKIRSRFGAKPVTAEHSLRAIVKRRHDWRAYALVADLAPRNNSEKYWGKVFGLDTACHIGPETLAKITKYPVVYVGMHKVKRGFYEITLEIVAQPPYQREVMQVLPKYLELFEKSVLNSPGTWTWNYKRWDQSKPIYKD